jgi:hypothetical protein
MYAANTSRNRRRFPASSKDNADCVGFRDNTLPDLRAFDSLVLIIPPFEKGGRGGILRTGSLILSFLNPPQSPFVKGGS